MIELNGIFVGEIMVNMGFLTSCVNLVRKFHSRISFSL